MFHFNKRVFLLLAFSIFIVTSGLRAEPAEQSTDIEPSNRMLNRIGAYAGFLGDPFPTVIGINVAYNVFDFMRVSAGFGKVSSSLSIGDASASASATTIGGGARFFVPGWSLSPVLGINYAHVSLAQSSPDTTVSIQNFTQDGGHFYGTLGVDWQLRGGFNLGGGYNLSFKSGIGGMPYLNVGWFFNFV